MNLVKTQLPDFCRDTNNFALINTNVEAYRQYKLQRKNTDLIAKQELTINKLSEEIKELKDIVKQLVKEKNG